MKTVTSSGWNRRRCLSALGVGALGAALLAACGRKGAAHSDPRPPVKIYPSGDALPANHLKFYLEFTGPMREGVFLEYCHLLDERGESVLEPFRETELWSENRCRLTLWLHPGRQKTGVNLNEEFGPVLEPNRNYTLVISGRWPRESGAPLGEDVRKAFGTIARATQQLDPATWRMTLPRAGSRDFLEVRFPAPLDHALLLRCLNAADSDGPLIRDDLQTADAERVWRFQPAWPWKPGPHRLRVESVLEDLAGNSLARPFERDLQAPAPKPVPPIVEIPFRPIPARPAP